MPRYQYRVAGSLAGMSASGNAIWSLVNKNGSGKRITIRRVEITPLAALASTNTQVRLQLARCSTLSGGELLAPTKFDTNASAWPSTVRVVTGAGATFSAGSAFARAAVFKAMAPATWFAVQRPLPTLFGGLYRSPRKNTDTEKVVVRAGEAVALTVATLPRTVPLRVSALLTRAGSPARTYAVQALVPAAAVDQALLAVDNAAGSGETITLSQIYVEETGDTITPYFQLVPVGTIIEGEAATAPPILKLDTAHPDPSSWLDLRQDTSVLPFGMPENALADSSTGSPKAFNYLKTKDFLGPVYRTVFPEYYGSHPTGFDWGQSPNQRLADPLTRKAAITIREGEGIALVSAAETAAGATVAVGKAGAFDFNYAVTFDVENAATPKLALTGLKPGTEVRVFDAGTTTELAGAENVNTGTFEWFYDTDAVSSVDISVLSLGYQNFRILGLALGTADVTVPVQQAIDRQFLNP